MENAPAVTAAPAASAPFEGPPISCTVGPGQWSAWTWVILLGVLGLLGLSIAFGRGSPTFPLQLAILTLIALVSVAAVLLQQTPWRLEADAHGVRRVVRGAVRDSIPWASVREVRYGPRVRQVYGSDISPPDPETGDFLWIRDKGWLHSIYVDTIYYSVSRESLALVTRRVLAWASTYGIRTLRGWR